jgi:surfactin synthase thioesterase subunit
MSVRPDAERRVPPRTDRDVWFRIHPASTAESRLRLICLPPAGAGVGAFHGWTGMRPGWLELDLVQLPGRDARLREPLPGDLRRLARTIRKQVAALVDDDDVPYALFGHSMGGLLAYEIAAALDACAVRPPEVLFVSGIVSPDDVVEQARMVRELDPVDVVRGVAGAIEELVDRPELLQIFLPVAVSDMGMIDTYRPSHHVLSCPIVVFEGDADPLTGFADVAAWARWTRGGFARRTFPGGHHYPTERPELVVAAVAELARAYVEW